MMATGLFYSEECLRHDTGGHPESRGRLQAILSRLRSASGLPHLLFMDAPAAEMDWVGAVHASSHLDRLAGLARQGGGWLDGDTYVSTGSLSAALHAAGGAVAAAEQLLRGDLDNAFVAVRPPGHHATPYHGMGFCLFNNVAVAVRRSQALGLARRVAVVDFDVHHGNGTQDLFYEDPSVLVFSCHQSPLYPGTGHYNEAGRGAGQGYTVNVPMPPGCGDEAYDHVMREVLAPALRWFRPDVLFVSAGYDSHWADPLAGMKVSVPGFGRLAERIASLAGELCRGRMVWVLEGGYDPRALAAAVEASVRVLSGGERDVVDPHGPAPVALGVEAVERVVAAVRGVHGL